jgi:Histone methylation protein DOT1
MHSAKWIQKLKRKLTVVPGVRWIIECVDEYRSRLYDWRHRVDTGGKKGLAELTVSSNNVTLGNSFQPTPPRTVRVLLQQLPINYSEYVFIDFGSGKGGVLLVAAEFPFREVIGIEFAEELHLIAERNICQYRGLRLCPTVRSVHSDAVQFQFPPKPLVLYFFNPFHRLIMEQVLVNLMESHRMNPREFLLLYQAPLYPKDLVLSMEGAALFRQTAYFDIYRIPA